MKEIKTKPVIKDIKVLDKTTDISRRMKNAYIQTKNQIEQHEHNNDGNYVNDAGNSIQKSTETILHKAGHAAENYSKNAIESAKASIRQSVSESGSRHTAKNSSSFQLRRKAATPTPDTFTKTRHTINQYTKTGDKTVKKTVKGTIKTSQKSVNSFKRATKATIKTSQAAAKAATTTTARTAVKSAQAAKRSAQAARMAARATAVSLKMSVKAIAVTIKASIAAVKGVTALIAAGGWIAVVVILVICLAGFLIGSVYGIFFSNESSIPDAPVMTEVIRRLNEEFAVEIKEIQDDNPHDNLEITGNENCIVNNWPEILAVYAVKVSTNPENGIEVATLDDAKVGILRGIFRDMNLINYWLETIEHKETVTATDKDGKEVEKIITVTETILHINMTSKSYLDMIEQYDFNIQQAKMLNELMQDENQQLFMQLISG